MRKAIAVVTALMIVGTTLLMSGCDSGTDTYSIDGDYNVGTVQFVYGENQTFTLREVIVTIDTSARDIFFSGIDRNGALWGYSGSYRHTGNRIIASDLPEVDFGSADQLDLRLEFTSSRRFEGVAINWVYDGTRLTDVGAANITGQETFIRSAEARDAAPTGVEKTPKLEIIQQQD
ncbi:MAG: hypothetical protein ACQER1_08780 [Armatimonadota bacterium]